MAEPRPRRLRVLAEESVADATHAGPRDEDHRENNAAPDLTVVVPDEPPLLTPLAAEALLRLIQHVAAQRDRQVQTDEGRAA